MKKLIMLLVIILIMVLLSGCWLYPKPRLISICVDPEGMFLEPGETEPIISVTANYEDGTSDKVDILDCNLNSENIKIATVNSKGLVTAVGSGATYIIVKYTERRFPIKITQEDIVQVRVCNNNQSKGLASPFKINDMR